VIDQRVVVRSTVLLAGALAALPAGRSMDSHGRVPVLAAGCCSGIAGCGLCGAGAAGGNGWLISRVKARFSPRASAA
jgi:MFS family permease